MFTLLMTLVAIFLFVYWVLSKRDKYLVEVELSNGNKKHVVIEAFSLSGANAKMADPLNSVVFISDKNEIIPREAICSWGMPVEYKKKLERT